MSTVEEHRRDNLECFLALRARVTEAVAEAVKTGDPETVAEAVIAAGESEWQYLVLAGTHEFKLVITVAGKD